MSKTRRMVLIAMLAALSTILLLPILQFPLLPGIDFMKVELSIIPVLIGVFTLGLGDGFIILFIRSVLWYLLFNQGPSTWIGVPMNFVALGIFMAIVWFFTKKKFSIKNYTMLREYTSQTDTIRFVVTVPFRIRQGKRFLST